MCATSEPYSPLTSLKIYEKNNVLCVKYKIFGVCTSVYEVFFKDVRRTNQEVFHQRIRKMVQMALSFKCLGCI